MLFVCYPKCSTCQKAKAWLQERGVALTSVISSRTIRPSRSCVRGTKETVCRLSGS